MADSKSPPPFVGTRMPDNTIYAGISPDTHTAMYTTPGDALVNMKFETAKTYTKNLTIGDKHDFRLPTYAELMVLFNAHAAIGGFTPISRHDYGLHWSADLRVVSFDTGGYRLFEPEYNCLVRCVRTAPPENPEPTPVRRPDGFSL